MIFQSISFILKGLCNKTILKQSATKKSQCPVGREVKFGRRKAAKSILVFSTHHLSLSFFDGLLRHWCDKGPCFLLYASGFETAASDLFGVKLAAFWMATADSLEEIIQCSPTIVQLFKVVSSW